MVNEVTDDPVASGMTLHSSEQLIDELMCDCCQTDVALASSGPVAVYRDRSVAEIRDSYITRLIDGRWQNGVLVGKIAAKSGDARSMAPPSQPKAMQNGTANVKARRVNANGAVGPVRVIASSASAFSVESVVRSARVAIKAL